MCKKFLLLLMVALVTRSVLTAQVAGRKIDTTMKAGKTGYRVTCSNKKTDKNMVTVSPVGFGKDTHDFSFEIKGTLGGTEADDLNRDGLIDLVAYVFSADSTHKGNVVGVINENNESLAPLIFPDILDDAKLRVGYKGHDTFYLMEGTLMRRFPVYETSAADTTTGATLTRIVQYQAVKAEAGRYKFSPVRSYQLTK